MENPIIEAIRNLRSELRSFRGVTTAYDKEIEQLDNALARAEEVFRDI